MTYKTIKQVTELTGITEGALRYYDEKDVIKPTIKKDTGRREWLYDDDAIRKLCMVKLFTFIGMPVKTAGLMINIGVNYADIMLRVQIETIRKEIRRNEYRIALAEKLLLQSQHTTPIEIDWLIEEIKQIELMEKEKEENEK